MNTPRFNGDPAVTAPLAGNNAESAATTEDAAAQSCEDGTRPADATGAHNGPTLPWNAESTTAHRHARTPDTAQTRVLRRTIVLKAAFAALVFTIAYCVFAVWANETVVPRIADEVADTTAPWTYMSAEEYDRFINNQESNNPNLDICVNWAHLEPDGENAASSGEAQDTVATDALDLGDWDYAVRDLSTYNALRACKLPAAIGLYLAGLLVILIVALNRSLRYFNELSTSITALFADREAPVELSDDLSIIRGELADIRAAALADNRAAAQAEQRKNELVAYLAHDIKTPLTSVMGYLTLLKEAPELPQETRVAYADIALDKAERLEGLVDEFFEITRYNLQSIPIERQTIDLVLLCRQVADEFYPEAQARSLEIKIDAPDTAPLFADPDKIGRALSNIVRNALAYADADTTVRIVVELTEDTARLRVIDRGREISPVHLQRIFEKFFREDASRSTEQGGTGLGLAIAREIVQAHGGDITATSEHGTTAFTVTLPREAH